MELSAKAQAADDEWTLNEGLSRIQRQISELADDLGQSEQFVLAKLFPRGADHSVLLKRCDDYIRSGHRATLHPRHPVAIVTECREAIVTLMHDLANRECGIRALQRKLEKQSHD